jgi:hypothetical protein
MKELKKIQATEVGWQRLLLSLYIESHGQDWLPPFDVDVASSILGNDATAWSASRRRQAATLYFERFDALPALSFLAAQLTAAFASTDSDSGTSGTWARERLVLFRTDGPEQTAKVAREGERLQQLMERLAILPNGAFAVKLRQCYLLEALKNCPLGAEPVELTEVQEHRSENAVDNLSLGAAALRILVSRVEKEGRGKWPERWRDWLVPLGCDPRMGRHTAEAAKWWGWATNAQWNLAVQGVIGLSLKTFFDFLDGTVSVSQWEERRRFLERCFEEGKILDARLALNARCMQRLPRIMRDRWSTATLRSTTEDTCIIALYCTDEVYLLEGTHSFGLRAFHRTFPVNGFWKRTRQEYADSELRISPGSCPVFIRHSGDWVGNFLHELRYTFHVEWKGWN